MTDLTQYRPAFSNNVVIVLKVGSDSFPLAQIGPKSITFREAVEIQQETYGTIEMIIAGVVQQWEVFLPHGAVPYENTAVAWGTARSDL